MVKKYCSRVQPLRCLELINIPEKRFGWRSMSALGMPQVWLEEGLAQRFQVSAGAHLELMLVDTSAKLLVNNVEVKLSDEYALQHPVVGGKRQVKSALLEICDELKNDGASVYRNTTKAGHACTRHLYKTN